MNRVTIIGRSSSHFTRITRIIAREFEVSYDFEIINDLLSLDASKYGGHPSLKLPSLRTDKGTWFGSLPISRQLAFISNNSIHITWPEELSDILTSNFQELVTTAMNNEVSLIMSKNSGFENSIYQQKIFESLKNTIDWLEVNIKKSIELLPTERDLSFLEVSLFCLIEHLEFREILNLSNYKKLGEFRRLFMERPSAIETPFHLDS